MIIIPIADTDKNKSDAQSLLLEVARQRRKVACVVFGDTSRAREIASRADVRADDHPARQVVWLPDVSVLAPSTEPFPLLNTLATARTEAAFFTLEFELSSTLGGVDALRFSRLELAFARALAGERA